MDFSDMKWERGDITFLFNGNSKPSHSLTVLDNKMKVYHRIRNQVNVSVEFVAGYNGHWSRSQICFCNFLKSCCL